MTDFGVGRGISGDEQPLSPFVTHKPIPDTIVRRGADGYMRAGGIELAEGLLQVWQHILTFEDAFPADDTFLSHTASGVLAWLPAASFGGTVDWSQIINKPVTISGYGIIDAYTKTQIDAIIAESEREGEALMRFFSG